MIPTRSALVRARIDTSFYSEEYLRLGMPGYPTGSNEIPTALEPQSMRARQQQPSRARRSVGKAQAPPVE
jgi:hypothetical protein